MSEKAELERLVGLLSEDECEHLLGAVRDISTGERFWEDDIGLVYNEYVKSRYFNISRNLASVVPAGPAIEHGIFSPIPIVKRYPGATVVPLPPPGDLPAAVGASLQQRRSRRDYTPDELSIETLSTLLHYAAGMTDSVAGYDYERMPLRSFPSAGGLQSPELYLSVQRVAGVPPGIYHYQTLDHALEELRSGDHRRTLQEIAIGQPYVMTANVVFLITGVYDRLRWKYGERAYRYMCMDVGFLGENLYLAAEAQGLGACGIAGFVDDALEQLLDIDGRTEIAMLLVTVGRNGLSPNGHTSPPG